MHKDLDKWLDDVWGARDRILKLSTKQGYIQGRGASAGMENRAVKAIYKMYSDSGSAAASTPDDSHLSAMRTELVLLEPLTDKGPTVQYGNNFFKKGKNWMATAPLDELRNRFFHYVADYDVIADYRIYINATPASCASVFRNILDKHGVWKGGGLHSAKVSSPDDPRADTIVIYVSSETVTKALARIAAYHRGHQRNFVGSLPKLVVPAESEGYRMAGVGTAMEPPPIRLVSTGGDYYKMDESQSFGSYRSELIFMALERTRWEVAKQTEEQRKTAFKNRAAKYFVRAGIDPNQPALQKPITALPDLKTIEGWANTTDNKPVFPKQ